MKATSSLLAIRAVGAEFARRLYIISCIVTALIAGGLIALLVWLTTLDAWWWLLGIPLTVGICIAAVLLIIVWLVIRYVRPDQTKEQKKAVRSLAGKMQSISDATQIPRFMLLFRVVRDIAAPTKQGFIGSFFHDTNSLRKEFEDLERSFQSH